MEAILWITFVYLYFGLWLKKKSYQTSHYWHKVTLCSHGVVNLTVDTNIVGNSENG